MFRYECVVAIGCPGDSFLKVTTGDFISYINVNGNYGSYQGAIKHSASTDKGSSGGPLFNWRLKLVGLNTWKTSDGKAAAVNSTDIKNFISQYNISM